jgi:hypothetical protein
MVRSMIGKEDTSRWLRGRSSPERDCVDLVGGGSGVVFFRELLAPLYYGQTKSLILSLLT